MRNTLLAPNKPPDAGEIENTNPEPVEESVIRDAGMARPIDHVDIADVKAFAADQRREKAVQRVEIWQRQEQIAPECLEAAASIARAVLEDCAPHGIGDARLQFLET